MTKLWAGHKQVSMAPYGQNLSGDYDLDICPSDIFLFVTHRLVMMIMCAI